MYDVIVAGLGGIGSSAAYHLAGRGYKFCSVVGEVLADLVTDGETQHPIDHFSPARLVGTARG